MVQILNDAGLASPYMAADPLLMISGYLANSVLDKAYTRLIIKIGQACSPVKIQSYAGYHLPSITRQFMAR